MGQYQTMYTKEGHLINNENFPDMPAYFGENTPFGVKLAYIPQIGYPFTYQDKSYEIMSVTTYQEKPDKSVITTHVLTCLETDENGDGVGSEPLILKLTDNSDIYGITGF